MKYKIWIIVLCALSCAKTNKGLFGDIAAYGPSDDVSQLTAIPDDGQVILSWKNPESIFFAGVKIQRKVGSPITDKNDGTTIYKGSGTTVTDTGLANGTPYYYKVFTYSETDDYSGGVQVSATPTLLPVVISSTPANFSANVEPCEGSPCRARIKVQFNKTMQLVTPSLTTEFFDGTSYVSVSPAGTSYPWSTTRVPNDTLTMNLSWVQFPENTQIRYTLGASNLKDLAGKSVVSDIQRHFSTKTMPGSFSAVDTDQTQCFHYDGANWLLDNACVLSYTNTDQARPLGQDGHYGDTPVQRNFGNPTPHTTFINDYTTKDNVTGLVWSTCSVGQSGAACGSGSVNTYSWYGAVNQCLLSMNIANSGSGYAGRKDWRLPTVMELESLTNLSKVNPAINIVSFPATGVQNYWTSTSYLPNPAIAWAISFVTGGTDNTQSKATLFAVRCVAGQGVGVKTSFTDNGNGAVTDARTNLVWQQCVKGRGGRDCATGTATTQQWRDAVLYCTNLSLAGRTNWRLPSKNELLTIIDRGRSLPAIDTVKFPETAVLWSSTTYAGNYNYAWIANMFTGNMGVVPKTSNGAPLCVTGP